MECDIIFFTFHYSLFTFLSHICAVKGIQTHIYMRAEKLPTVEDSNFFHSRQLFSICSDTPRMKPYMVVCTDEEGRVLCQLLAIVRYRTTFLPPFMFIQCRVLGDGVYAESAYRKDELFGEMIMALTQKLNKKVLYIEFSDLSQKMFGYKQFRQNNYFPVHWMSIHNSLHSRTPEERITEKMLHHIENAYARGVTCQTVESQDDLIAFNKLLHQHHWFKPKRYIPDNQFFNRLKDCEQCQLFVTKFHDHIIGCSACAYHGSDAFLWYSAFRRKSYLMLHPDEVTIWHAIKYAHEKGYDHITFMDVGLPFKKNSFREFILRFGGKPVSTYRWFRCSIRWINSMLSYIYKD